MELKKHLFKHGKNFIAILIIAVLLIGSFMIGNVFNLQESYAASQYDTLNQFKVEGDYLEIATDTVGKESLAAVLPERSHVAAVSGIYTLQIWTPKGEDAEYYHYAKNSYKVTQTYNGTPGQYMSIDVKIAKGSKLTTVGNLAEGVGIRGVIQLAGGNGADLSGQSPSKNDYIKPSSPKGYFGGNGGKGHRASLYNGPAIGGTGYCGGIGGVGSSAYQTSATGGNGFVAGEGGAAPTWIIKVNNRDEIRTGIAGEKGNTYDISPYKYPLNQIPAGTVKYRTGGAFPSFTTSDYNGTDARIRITLKSINNNIGVNDGIVSVEINQSSSWEAMVSMAGSFERIASALENGSTGSGGGNGGSTAPSQSDVATVVKGKSFDIYIPIESSKAGTTIVDTVTVINNDVTDGVLQLVGIVNNSGNKELVVGDVKFVIQTVEEPDSTNVSAVLN